MNVKEMIEALQKQDPNASANDALREIRKAPPLDMSPEGLVAHHARLHAHAKTHTDKKGNGNDPADLDLVAFNGVRSDVFGQLQEESPVPSAAELAPTFAALKGEKAKMAAIAEVQKAHNVDLWERADALVAAAGIAAPAQKGGN